MKKNAIKEELKDNLDKEKNFGRQIGPKLFGDTGTITQSCTSIIYPEYDQLLKNHAYHRPKAPIGHMALLYPQIVVYVPPIKASDFPNFFGIDYETFLNLAYPEGGDPKRVYPILSFPTEYINHWDELKELLMKRPPTWTRWHGALEETGYDSYFYEAKEKISEKLLNQISQNPGVRNIWSHEYPHLDESNPSIKATLTRLIKQQIINNYTDILMFLRVPRIPIDFVQLLRGC